MTETNGLVIAHELQTQSPQISPTGTDEHRVELARWVLDTFAPDTAIFKKAQKVLEAYLAGKALPKVE